MMRPWRDLNLLGRLLLICCIINVWVAIVLAVNGSLMCIFSGIMGAFCGLSTYLPRYSYMDAKDINNKNDRRK